MTTPAISISAWAGKHLVREQDLLTLLTRHAANAEDINTIVDRIHKNHRFVRLALRYHMCRVVSSVSPATFHFFTSWLHFL